MHKLVEAFALTLRDDDYSPATIERYTEVMEEFTSFLDAELGGSVTLEAVQKAHILSFLRRGTKTVAQPSASVWNTRLATLRTFYRNLYEEELIDVNPSLRAKFRDPRPDETIPLSWEEFLSLVDATGRGAQLYRSRNAAIIQVFFHCLLRVSELVSLSIDQVDFERHQFTNVEVKGGKKCSIPFNDLVADYLERYLKNREAFGAPAEERALFLSNRGQRMSVRSVEAMMAMMGKRAGIARAVYPHLIRHSGATELAELGAELPIVQRQLNHESVRTTQHYVHPRDTARRMFIEELGRETARRLRQRSARRGPQQKPTSAPSSAEK
jgi:site-specific recombinase XerD